MTTAVTERFWRKPLDSDRIPRIKGRVTVLEERCKGCIYCVEFCPTKTLARSQRINSKGYHPPDVAAQELCVACRACLVQCDTGAIQARRMDRGGGI